MAVNRQISARWSGGQLDACKNALISFAETWTCATQEGQMKETPKGYRSRAEECRRLAEISPKLLRRGYLRLAAAYEKLAEEIEEEVRVDAKLKAPDAHIKP